MCHFGLKKGFGDLIYVVFSVEPESSTDFHAVVSHYTEDATQKNNMTDLEDKMLKGPESPLLMSKFREVTSNRHLSFLFTIVM